MLYRSLAERYSVLVRLDGPKHQTFITYDARLRLFGKGWPHRRHNVEEFSAAGFFYTGMGLTITLVQTVLLHYTRIYLSLILLLLQVWLIKPNVFIVARFGEVVGF
jgi:hypothetical protein